MSAKSSKPNKVKYVSPNPRAHTKTVVIANGIKTRMNCDHLNPRCSCGKKVKQHKKEDGANVYATPKQNLNVRTNAKKRNGLSTTSSLNENLSVPSVRANPRGGTNGRKHYDTIENDGPPTNIVEEDWSDRRNDYSFNNNNNSTNSKQLALDSRKLIADSKRLAKDSKKFIQETKTNSPMHNSKEIFLENHKKSVQFADTIEDVRSNRQRHNSDECLSDPIHNYNSSRGRSRAYRYSNYEDLNERERYSTPQYPTSHNSHNNSCTMCTSHGHEHKKHYSCNENESELEYLQRRLDNLRESRTHIPCFMCEREPDFLCRRFGNVCNTHNRISSHSPQRSRENVCSHENSLKSRLSDNTSINGYEKHSVTNDKSYNDHRFVSENIIPYEPRSDIVRDLKKKLEDEYREERMSRKHTPYRGIHSWDTDDLEDLRNYRKLKGMDNLDLPRHRCNHHYIQNDRLFLEPANTDSSGRSLCRDCRAPQPHNSHQDPYLYHIHLGDFKDTSSSYNYNQDKQKNNILVNKPVHKMNDYPAKSSNHPPGILKQNGRRSNSLEERGRLDYNEYKQQKDDSSKHLYANSDCENDIYPRKFRFIDRCRTSDELRYQNNSSYGRHHKTSMALRDHLFHHR